MRKPGVFDRLEGQVSINRLQGYAIAFVVIGVVLAVGLTVMGNVKDEMVIDTAVSNESDTVNFSEGTTTWTLDNTPVVTGSYTVYNDSAQTTQLTEGTDYTVIDLSNGTFRIDRAAGGNVYTDYTYEADDTEAQQGATNAIDGLSTFTEWLPIIALVIISAIIIGLVSMFNSSSGQRGRA